MRLSKRAVRQLSLQGRDVRLQPREYDLLRRLAEEPGKVCSVSKLYSAVYGHEVVQEAQIAWIISRLRRLGLPIITCDRRGYVLDVPANEVWLD